MSASSIQTFQSCAPASRIAARELHQALWRADLEMLMFFCSAHYDLHALGGELNNLFAGIRVIGCTTAGEIGPAGYRNHSVSAVGFAADACTAVSAPIEGLGSFNTLE